MVLGEAWSPWLASSGGSSFIPEGYGGDGGDFRAGGNRKSLRCGEIVSGGSEKEEIFGMDERVGD
jgi:hypothetical protein